MNAVPFDALKLARDFESAGLTPPVAADAASALADALIGADLATKADLAQLEGRMQLGFAAVGSKLERLRRDTTVKRGGMISIAVGVLLTAMRLMPHP
jgi:hypothetical protein